MSGSFTHRPSRSCGAILIAISLVSGCKTEKQAPPTPPPAAVTVIHPVLYPVQSYFDYNGYLDAVESVQIQARVEGFLTGVHFREGDEVTEKTLLYTIDPREYDAMLARSKADIAKAEADMENSKAQIVLAQAELDRMNRSGLGATSRSEIDKAAAQVAANKASLNVAIANKAAAEAARDMADQKLGYTKILAPISGRISRTRVTPGNLVGHNEATLLTTIVRMDPLYVYFDVPERDLVEYQKTLATKTAPAPKNPGMRIEVGIATEEGFPHKGFLDFQENRVETGTGTVRLRGKLDNPSVSPGNARLLYPGLFSRIRVPVGEEKNKPVIPEDALMTGQEGRFVYVVGKENIVQKRTVIVGPQIWRSSSTEGNALPGWSLSNSKTPAAKGQPAGSPVRSMIAIEKGLEAGDLVIVVGLQKARPGAPVAPDEWELRKPAAAPVR